MCSIQLSKHERLDNYFTANVVSSTKKVPALFSLLLLMNRATRSKLTIMCLVLALCNRGEWTKIIKGINKKETFENK
jgi:hypothetical protein